MSVCVYIYICIHELSVSRQHPWLEAAAGSRGEWHSRFDMNIIIIIVIIVIIVIICHHYVIFVTLLREREKRVSLIYCSL